MKIFTKTIRTFVVALILVNLATPYTAHSSAVELSKDGIAVDFSKFTQDNNVKLEDIDVERLNEEMRQKEETSLLNLDTGLYTGREFSTINKQSDNKKIDYVPGELVVKFKDSGINFNKASNLSSANTIALENNLSIKEELKSSGIVVMKTKDKDRNIEELIVSLKNNPLVEYVQPNYLYYPSSIPTNDTYRNQLWALENTGQTINGTSYSGGIVAGTSDADIDGLEAWAISEGDPSVIVAVIDTGVAYNHPDLTINMWDGSTCKDVDGNYLGGCNHGYDFAAGDKTPLPTSDLGFYYSHGTHIAGTIAAIKNNNKGIVGVSPQARIMALKSDLTTVQNIAAINFAKFNGAKVINASWGGPGNDLLLKGAIDNFPGLFIAAAGNSTLNHSITHNYPCDFDSSNIICVAAADQNDNLASFSDYGVTSIDVGAPGVNILSTVADSVILNEAFQNVTPPNIPSGWSKTGNWGTYQLNPSNRVLYGDYNHHFPYSSNANYTINSQTLNLQNTADSLISFDTVCDTEPYLPNWDYMALEFSNGGSYAEVLRWNEYGFNGNFDYIYTPLGDRVLLQFSGGIPSEYLTSNFNFRLRWVADDLDNNYEGCLIDSIKITKFSDGSDELYDYYEGTSMAAPHVAGLAGLIWSVNPALTYTDVKNAILDTGDLLPSLNGKTVSGKRINANNALQSLVSAGSISGTVYYYDGVKTVPNATVILENDLGNRLATATTTSAGFYQFTDLASGNYVVKVQKDNDDSAVSGTDLTKIRRHIVELEIFDSIFKVIASDVNTSGSTTGTDLTKIRRYIVSIEDLPLSWKFYSSDATVNQTNYLTDGFVRIYTNLSSDMIDQNFTAVKMGDVNNSWISQ